MRMLQKTLTPVLALLLMGNVQTTLASGGCDFVVAAGETFFNGAGFEGSAYSSLGDLNVSVALLSQAETGSGLRASTSHTLTAVDGSMSVTTRDNAMLKPLDSAGLFELRTQAIVIEGGHGKLTIYGLVDFARGWARWTARGQVCSE